MIPSASVWNTESVKPCFMNFNTTRFEKDADVRETPFTTLLSIKDKEFDELL